MKKIISTFAIFMTFSVTAIANTCEQPNSVRAACDGSAVSNARFAGLGGIFGHQLESEVSKNVQQERHANSSRFVGLGGLFGGQQKADISLSPILVSAL